MFLRAFCVSLLMLAVSGSQPAGGQAVECPRLAVSVNLEKFIVGERFGGKQQGEVDTGKGLILKMEPLGGGEPGARLTAWYQNASIIEFITKGWFSGFSRQEAGPVTYWLVEDYSGGAHCCTSHHFFCQPHPQAAVRFLGTINLGHADPTYYQEQLSCKDGMVYHKDFDGRFAYFLTGFAMSGAMFFPRFHRLTPEGISLINQQFKEVYLDEIKEINQRISEEAASRGAKKPALFNERGDFTDDLGVLLAARTIYYLCAREDDTAWQSLAEGVQRYYQSSRGLDSLKREIIKEMQSQPY